MPSTARRTLGESAGALWDARAQIALGTFIRRYVAENPAPDDATLAVACDAWSKRLLTAGQVRLEALQIAGVPVLCAVP